jgi:hypothetical protein
MKDRVMRFAFWRSSANGRPEGLASAANSALRSVLKQDGAMARLAEREGRPDLWIANSILRTVSTVGRSPDQACGHALSKKDIFGLTLSDNMSALYAQDSAQPRYIELGLHASELKKYLRWAKTVQ